MSERGIHVTMRNLTTTHISDVVTDILTSKMILIGSPTFNNGLLPTIGSFLTYIKGLRPRKRIGFAFGSYGWSGQAAAQIEEAMKELKWELPKEVLKINYIPEDDELNNIKEIGKELGDILKEK
jgi:flavorubredoxin